MSIDHFTAVIFAKSFGLFYLLLFSVAVLIYIYWPKNKKKFDKAARDIIDDEDKPWQ